MSELMRLREDHAKLARMFQELEHIIDRPQAPAQIELFKFRQNLMSTLIGHLKLEDWALYPRLIESGDDEISAKGEAFRDEMGGLAPAFLAYCDKWAAGTIHENWAGYCSDTRALLASLRDRLVRENRELLPMLERLDRAA